MQITTFPLVKAGIFFIAGIGFYSFIPAISTGKMLAFIGFYLLLAGFLQHSFFGGYIKTCLLFINLFIGGAYWIHLKIKQTERQNLPSQLVTVQGYLASDPKPGLKTIRAELMVSHVAISDNKWKRHHARVLVYVPSETKNFLTCRQQDFIQITGRISEIMSTSNPGAFDFKKFCLYKGITQQIFVRDSGWQLISARNPYTVTGFAGVCRDRLARKIEEIIPDTETASVIKALLLGVKDDVSEELYQHFSRTGAIHLLAVSGLHVGAVLYIFVLFFKRFKRFPRIFKVIQPIILAVIALFYLLLTGASPSVCRAALMFLLLLTGRIWFRSGNSMNMLMVSAIWMLLYDPFLLYNLSFQFSYISLCSILLFQPVIRLWYIPDNRVFGYVWDLTSVSLAAQVLVFPLSVYYFHQFPVYFALTNIFAIPMAIFLVYSGFSILLTSAAGLPILQMMQGIYAKTAGIFIDGIQWVSTWPGACWENLYLEKYEVVILYMMILTLYIYTQTQKPRFFYYSMIIMFSLLVNQLRNEVVFVNQSILCIYDAKKETLIDYIEGNTAFCIKGESFRSTSEKMVCFNNRLRRGVNKTIHGVDSLRFSSSSFVFQNPILSVRRQKIWISGNGFSLPEAKDSADIIVVTRGIRWPGIEWARGLQNTLIILAGNVPEKDWQQWTSCLQENQIAYRDARKEGYIEIELK